MGGGTRKEREKSEEVTAFKIASDTKNVEKGSCDGEGRGSRRRWTEGGRGYIKFLSGAQIPPYVKQLHPHGFTISISAHSFHIPCIAFPIWTFHHSAYATALIYLPCICLAWDLNGLFLQHNSPICIMALSQVLPLFHQPFTIFIFVNRPSAAVHYLQEESFPSIFSHFLEHY